MQRVGASVVALALLGVSLSACSASSSSCQPARLSASPTVVRVGGDLTVSSAAAGCDLGFEHGTRYSVVLESDGGNAKTDPLSTAVSHDGQFSVRISVPHDFPSGRADVSVSSGALDALCGDREISCASYQTVVQVTD